MAKKAVSLGSILSKMKVDVPLTTPQSTVTPTAPAVEEKKVLDKGVVMLNLGEIKTNPRQPRKVFDENSISELAKSISHCGVIQPLVVCLQKGEYILVAGERRLRACTLLGLEKVPVILIDVEEKKLGELALIENIQRENLNPIDEAEAIKEIMESEDISQEELAQRLGKSRPALTNTLRLLALPQKVREMISSGQLSSGHGRALLSLQKVDKILALAKECVEKGWSVRELEKRCGELAPTPKKTKKALSPELSDFEEDMQRVFATDVSLSGNLKKGKIVIKYSSDGELRRIYDIIQEFKSGVE